MASVLHRRAIASVLSDRLDASAVVRLSGPRAAGKTTTCALEVERRDGTILRLDDPDVRRAVRSDPTGALAGLRHPVLIDEYQHVPDVLDAIKVDLSVSGTNPGQWVICGSVSITAVTGAAESLGGRMADVRMGTLTVDERNDLPEPSFLAAVTSAPLDVLRSWRPIAPLGRDGLLEEAIRGGFPAIADTTDPAARRRRLEEWVDASVIADGAAVGGVRDVESLRRMTRLYAAATATVTPKDRPIADQLDINRRTVASYRDLLTALHVTWDLPAFVPGNAIGQVVKSPKLHMVDSGLAAMLAGRDHVVALGRDQQQAGALAETMVANDLRVQAAAHPGSPRHFHYRDADHEVDIVVETHDGRALGIEVKLTTNPGDRDLRGLRRLRQTCGSRWAGGVVLCRVPVGRLTDDGLAIAPIEALWQFVG